MNNQEALDFLNSHSSIRVATQAFMNDFDIPESEFSSIRRRFSEIKSSLDLYRKKNDLDTWEQFLLSTSSCITFSNIYFSVPMAPNI